MSTATINIAIEIEGDQDACDKIAKTVNDMPNIIQRIVAERARQDQQWGGPEHDDGHGPRVWEDILSDHVTRLTDVSGDPATDYRDRMVKIAAIAVAAVQTWDRAQS